MRKPFFGMAILGIFLCVCMPPPEKYTAAKPDRQRPGDVVKENGMKVPGGLEKMTEAIFAEGITDENRIVRLLSAIGYQILLLRKDIETGEEWRVIRKKL